MATHTAAPPTAAIRVTIATGSALPPDSVRITDFPALSGGCAACSDDLDYGCSAIPVDHGHVHEDCWDDYLSLITSPTSAREIS